MKNKKFVIFSFIISLLVLLGCLLRPLEFIFVDKLSGFDFKVLKNWGHLLLVFVIILLDVLNIVLCSVILANSKVFKTSEKIETARGPLTPEEFLDSYSKDTTEKVVEKEEVQEQEPKTALYKSQQTAITEERTSKVLLSYKADVIKKLADVLGLKYETKTETAYSITQLIENEGFLRTLTKAELSTIAHTLGYKTKVNSKKEELINTITEFTK